LRRRKALAEHQEDERERQQKRRDARISDKCHEPASAAKWWELLSKVEQIVDKVGRLSRAGFRREILRILRENATF
jgi:hypothetical protein